MTTELSSDNFVLRIVGGVNIYINKQEVADLKSLLKNRNIDSFEIKGKFIMKSAVQYIVPALDIEVQEKKSRGMWQCKEKGHWNDKGTTKCISCYY